MTRLLPGRTARLMYTHHLAHLHVSTLNTHVSFNVRPACTCMRMVEATGLRQVKFTPCGRTRGGVRRCHLESHHEVGAHLQASNYNDVFICDQAHRVPPAAFRPPRVSWMNSAPLQRRGFRCSHNYCSVEESLKNPGSHVPAAAVTGEYTTPKYAQAVASAV